MGAHPFGRHVARGAGRIGLSSAKRYSSPVDSAILCTHVEALAGAPRVPGTTAHARAAAYVRESFERLGLRTTIERHGPDGDNIIAEFGRPEQPLVVVGAHYDSVPGSPGADDNASGVAALLEIAHALVLQAPRESHRVQLVAFDQEEAGLLGSAAHCRALRRARADVRAMLSLEMLGYTSAHQTLVEGAGVTRDAGDFLAVVANRKSEALLDAFRPHGRAVECVSVDEGSEAAALARLSDHGAFWAAGWRALLVTDTAFLRNPHYHQPTDTPDTLDYDFLRRSAETVADALVRLTS